MRQLRLLAVLLALSVALPLAAAIGLAGPAGLAGARTALAQEATCADEDFPGETLEIMAPAGTGGGWDTTAREMQRVLDGEIIDQSVEVFNVEGSGGTIGLAELVNEQEGNEHLLMMMGLVMVGAIETNQSEVSLAETTPIARLTTEYEVVVVPAESEFQTLDDLLAAFQEDPAGTAWGGGSAGGTDHILVGLIAQAVGVDPAQINYVAYSGGGEALAGILAGDVAAGVSGVGEWQDQIASGELRALAVSGTDAGDAGTPAAAAAAATPAASVAPTLQEQGVDVELANWRGVVAPPGISDEARQCLIAMVTEMRDSDAWQAVLANYGWSDYFLPGDEYAAFLESERERVTETLRGLGLVE